MSCLTVRWTQSKINERAIFQTPPGFIKRPTQQSPRNAQRPQLAALLRHSSALLLYPSHGVLAENPLPPLATYQTYDVDYPYYRSLTSVGRVLLFFLHGNWGDEVCPELCLGQLFPNDFFFW
jgi:hypothetical protein